MAILITIKIAPMNHFRKMKTEVLRNILAAYTASYGRMLTEAEAIECKETIDLISLELDRRINDKQEQDIFMTNGATGTKSFMSGLF